jgi:hypothetical protein
MDEQTAKIIIVAGFAVGFVVWLAALQLYRRMADAPHVERLEAKLSGVSPAEAIRSMVDGALPAGGQAKLSRPRENALHISQSGVEMDLTASHAGGQTLVVAEIDDSTLRRRFQIPLAILVTLVMPLVVAGVPVALWYFAAPDARPPVRWQCLQVLQISHVLWPPFLVYFQWKRQRELALNGAANLLVRAETG